MTGVFNDNSEVFFVLFLVNPLQNSLIGLKDILQARNYIHAL